jgi:hypothetical protein
MSSELMEICCLLSIMLVMDLFLLIKSCEYGDFVKLFLHLNEEGVNEKTRWNSILCGKIADIEQTHYSSGSNLIFEFRSDWRNGNNTGFRGTYRFLNKRKCFIHFIS